MDIQTLMQAITTMGFPIVCCGALMYYVKYIVDSSRAEITALNDRHKEEMAQITDALNNNTLALTKLCDLLGKDLDHEKVVDR